MSQTPSSFTPTPYTPSGDASYTPTQGNYKELKPFRYWCQKVLPLVYDDSLSYYELLCKVVDYLNKTMEDVDTLHDDVDNLHTAYTELETDMNNKYHTMTQWMNSSYTDLVNFVNTYFANLDVQTEINNKLDVMAQDGTLSALIEPYVQPKVNNKINSMVTSGEFADIVSPFVPPAVNTKINGMVGDGSFKAITDPKVVQTAEGWLEDNITNPSNPPLDKSLSLATAAAPAKTTGIELNLLDSTCDEIAMEINPGYSAEDFTAISANTSVVINDTILTFSHPNAVASSFSGMISNKNYINFNTDAFYILAAIQPSWSNYWYCLAVSTTNGALYSICLDTTAYRTYDTTLNVGTSNQVIRAYKKNGEIVIKLKGTKNYLDITTLLIVPDRDDLGYWSLENIRFGVAFQDSSKAVGYRYDCALFYGGDVLTDYTSWNTLKPNRWYNVPAVQGRVLPPIFTQYGVENGLLEVFKPTVNTSVLYRFTGGSSNTQFLARYDNGVLSAWRLSFAEGRLLASLPDFSSPRFQKAATSLDTCIEVGSYTVPHTVTLPEIMSDKGITNGGLIVLNGFAENNTIILQIFLAGTRDYVFTRFGFVDLTNGEITNASPWKELVVPSPSRVLFSDNVYYALGDSITAGSWSDDDGNATAVENADWAYCKQIANALGCTLHNLGKPGWTSGAILNGSGSTPSEVSLVGSDATLITIMCGTNDYRENTPLGTANDITSGTICGNLYQILYQVIQTAPKARVIVLSPIPGAAVVRDPSTHEIISVTPRRSTPNTAGWDYDDLLKQYQLLCEKYGVEFVNCMTNGPVNSFNLTDMLGDGSHPKKDTYDSLAQYIYSQIF